MENAAFEVIASAAVVVTATADKLNVDLVCPGEYAIATVEVKVLDQCRQPLEVAESTSGMVPLEAVSNVLETPRLKRSIAALGDRRLCYCRLEMRLPLGGTPWSLLGINVTTLDDCLAEYQQFYVERTKRSWGLTAHSSGSSHAFLLTDQQIEDQTNWLAANYGLAGTDREECVDALSSLFLKLKGGFDLPLVWKEKNDGN